MSQPPPLPELPPIAELSDQQVRGTACANCGIILDNATAIDLGERVVRRVGGRQRWFPRACPLHGAAT